ncbi:MAG: hypothetical protein HY537_00990 [Deltaproteobacteria bacterium]|nr:hypothetical protein [Deltaproteobacteria bacterium]
MADQRAELLELIPRTPRWWQLPLRLRLYDETAWLSYLTAILDPNYADLVSLHDIQALLPTFATMPKELISKVQLLIAEKYHHAVEIPRYYAVGRLEARKIYNLILKATVKADEIFSNSLLDHPGVAYDTYIRKVSQIFEGLSHARFNSANILAAARIIQHELNKSVGPGPTYLVELFGNFPNGRCDLHAPILEAALVKGRIPKQSLIEINDVLTRHFRHKLGSTRLHFNLFRADDLIFRRPGFWDPVVIRISPNHITLRVYPLGKPGLDVSDEKDIRMQAIDYHLH